MKLTFKDLKKNAFSLETEPSTLVGEIKKQVGERQSAEPSQIRLIHAGKVLADDKAIETYNVKETDHIICMVQKPKATVASTSAAPSTPAPTTAQTPAAPAPATSSSTTTQDAPGTPTPAGAAPASSRAFDDTSPLMLGPQRQAAVANMESMGFERPQIERAMRAAFFNPDRAVEFLLNGIPENLQQEAAGRGSGGGGAGGANPPPATAATTTTPGDGTASAPAPSTDAEAVNLFDAAAAAGSNRTGGSGSTGSAATGLPSGRSGASGAAGGLGAGAGNAGNLDFLRNNPMFQQLRQLVQQDPSMLENVLQQVSAANPQLAQLISQNPEQFLQLVTEGVEGGEGGLPMPPGASGDIRVTEEERDAIERLINLGFERDLVIQAYFACDKNEELAANFLFDQPHDDDDDGPQGS